MFTQPSQRGQALVLIAFAIVGLIAITALAIDGGNVFSERRHAQSAADDGALAGGLAILNNPGVTGVTSVITAPIYSITGAEDNDFPNSVVSIARGVARSDGQRGAQFTGCDGSTLKIAAPLTSQIPNSDPVNHPEDYLQVMIHSSVDTYFGQVIGIDQMNYCVQAIVRAKPYRLIPAFLGNAVVGTDPNALSYHAHSNSQKWKIRGGGVFANHNAEDDHSNVEFPDGHCATAVGTATGFACPVSQGNPDLFYSYPDMFYPLMPPTPDCDGIATFHASDGKIHPDADSSKNGSVWSGGIVGDYAPGLYCITDAGGLIHSPITGTGVTFYFTEHSFSLKMDGGGSNAYIAASAPTSGDYQGVLMFGPITEEPCTQNLEIRGNGSTPIIGTIFMPSACINYLGNGTGDAMNSQIVGYQVYSNGTADLHISYNSDDNLKFPQPPVIELNK